MKNFLLLLLFLGSTSVPIYAQNPERNSSTRPVPSAVSATIEQVAPNVGAHRVLDLISGPRFSASILDGIGTFGSTGTGNEARILQHGDGNYVFLQQSGAANVVSVSVNGDDNQVYGQQNGDQNILEVSILNDGVNNVVPIVQDGDGNQLSLTLDGINNWTIGNLPSGLFETQSAAFVSPTGARVNALMQSSKGEPIPLRIEVRREVGN
jgi:hypothetical protein